MTRKQNKALVDAVQIIRAGIELSALISSYIDSLCRTDLNDRTKSIHMSNYVATTSIYICEKYNITYQDYIMLLEMVTRVRV